MTNLERHLKEVPPEFIYHYTTHAGFLGIAKNKTLWCSAVTYCNDGLEYEHAVALLRERLEFRIYGYDNIPRTDGEIKFLQSLLTGLDRVGKGFFIGSFSENGDLLSQWRGYSKNVDGLSLGFAATRLQELAQQQNFRFVKCIYHTEEKYTIVDEFINEFLHEPRGNDLPFNFAIRFSSIAPILKHESFHEEKEWRLISRQLDSRNPNIDFHQGSRILIPHYNFNLVEDDDPLKIERIIIGPSSIQKHASNSVQLAITKYKITWEQVSSSMCSYLGTSY